MSRIDHDTLLPALPGEGARRADEGRVAKQCGLAARTFAKLIPKSGAAHHHPRMSKLNLERLSG